MIPLTRFRALLLITAGFIAAVLFYSSGTVQDQQENRAAITLGESDFLDVEVAIPSASIGVLHGVINPNGRLVSPPFKDNSYTLPRPTQFPKTIVSPPSTHVPLNYTRNLVIASRSFENTSWPSLLPITEPPLQTLVYVVDDPNFHLTVPINKGNEAMVYLTYIISHYNHLSDISIFAHASRTQWHNPPLLDSDNVQLLSRLNSVKVVKDGYVNLRCDSNECPAHIRTANTEVDEDKLEEYRMADAWRGIFPSEPVPPILSQACCSQFAVSRAAILSRPLAEYVHMRDWLIQTDLENDISGRIFEYLWQWIFAREHIFCPESHKCYCDLYSVCFEGVFKFTEWQGLFWEKEDLEEELVALQSGGEVVVITTEEAEVEQDEDEEAWSEADETYVAQNKTMEETTSNSKNMTSEDRISAIVTEIEALTLDLNARKEEAMARGVEVRKWREQVEGLWL